MSDIYTPGQASMQSQNTGLTQEPVPVPGSLEDSSFDIGSCLGLAWQSFRLQWLKGTGYHLLMFLMFMLPFLVITIPSLFILINNDNNSESETNYGIILLGLMGISTIISLLVQPILLGAWFSGALQFTRRTLRMKTLLIAFKNFAATMGAGLLIAVVAMLIGMVFAAPYYYYFVQAILQGQMKTFQADPGNLLLQFLIYGSYPFQLFLYARFFLTYNLIADKGMGGIAALQRAGNSLRPFSGC